MAAWIIDMIAYWIVSAIAWFALTDKIPGGCVSGGVTINGDCRGFTQGSSGRPVWILIQFVAAVVIWVILPGLKSTSPGHAMMGLRIVGRDGGAPGIGRAIARWLMFIVDNFPYIIPGLVGFIAALTDSQQHRRLGDRVAGTLVVDKNAAGVPVTDGLPRYNEYGGPAPSGGGPAPGWYNDPQLEARLRYWDGTAWTSQTSA